MSSCCSLPLFKQFFLLLLNSLCPEHLFGCQSKWPGDLMLTVFCLGDGWCCVFWTGSIINQLYHQVMFDKCLHTLTKCWPQEPDLMKKRKKMHSQSSQTKARRNRKKGKPHRNGNVRCLFNLFRYKSLLISKLLASCFFSRSVWYPSSFFTPVLILNLVFSSSAVFLILYLLLGISGVWWFNVSCSFLVAD